MLKCKSCDAEIPEGAAKCPNEKCGVPTGVEVKEEKTTDELDEEAAEEDAEAGDEWDTFSRW